MDETTPWGSLAVLPRALKEQGRTKSRARKSEPLSALAQKNEPLSALAFLVFAAPTYVRRNCTRL
eukprot:12238522-Ditylum_brightwellii.AAC.1